ncbi:ATP-binding protein [Sinorhizobium sp. BG8]|uniref:sensor histidine kinase n=1 Tax=Sinorhizobium sp. BG8 TaxID=2613773 RepID=UPI00193CCF81|nr:ATP-binding protein [Sinorhizobium sp. BG8]
MISFTRLVFSAFALLAVYLDPTRPASFVEETYALLVAFGFYSAVIFYFSGGGSESVLWRSFVHLVDIAVLSLLIYLTDGLASPFFTFFIFPIFTATFRWGWRGSVHTALVLAIILVTISWQEIEMDFVRDSKLNVLIMRGVSLFLIAGMLGYLGAYLQRSRYRINKLAAWPGGGITPYHRPLTIESLRHASQVLGTPMLVVCWQESLHPAASVALCLRDSSELREASNSARIVELIAMVGQAAFHRRDSRAGAKLMSFAVPLLADLEQLDRAQQDHEIDTFCVAPFSSNHYRGCVFVFDPRYHNEDTVSLTEIVATRVSYELEQRALAKEVADAAIAQDRIRLAMNMHDSILQDLAAASLMLKASTSQVTGYLESSLKEIAWLLTHQQQRIRKLIQDMQSTPGTENDHLPVQLDLLAATLERQWRCRITTEVSPSNLQLSRSTISEIFQLVCEATANAVRHGGAKHVQVSIVEGQDRLRIQIDDDGKGLPEDTQMPILIKPRSITRRVDDLGGTLDLVTSRKGVHLQIELPPQ